jgi:hypothetical protein
MTSSVRTNVFSKEMHALFADKNVPVSTTEKPQNKLCSAHDVLSLEIKPKTCTQFGGCPTVCKQQSTLIEQICIQTLSAIVF